MKQIFIVVTLVLVISSIKINHKLDDIYEKAGINHYSKHLDIRLSPPAQQKTNPSMIAHHNQDGGSVAQDNSQGNERAGQADHHYQGRSNSTYGNRQNNTNGNRPNNTNGNRLNSTYSDRPNGTYSNFSSNSNRPNSTVSGRNGNSTNSKISFTYSNPPAASNYPVSNRPSTVYTNTTWNSSGGNTTAFQRPSNQNINNTQPYRSGNSTFTYPNSTLTPLNGTANNGWGQGNNTSYYPGGNSTSATTWPFPFSPTF